jgi:hypothetical protein
MFDLGSIFWASPCRSETAMALGLFAEPVDNVRELRVILTSACGYRSVLNGEGKLDVLMDDRYPSILPTTVRDYVTNERL